MSELWKDDELALQALRRAVAEALDRKRRLGQYAAIWRDGRVHLVGEDAPVPDAGRDGVAARSAHAGRQDPGPAGSDDKG